MVWGKDISVLLSISQDRSEFLQVCNMEWGYLFEASGIIQDDSGKATAQLSGSFSVILTVSNKEHFIRFCTSQLLDVS